MWLTAPNRIGIAAWQSCDSIWRIETRGGGRGGIELSVGDDSVALVGSDGKPLPAVNERFVRANELHLSFPQAGEDCQFGFRLVVRPVALDQFQTGRDRAIFELLVSVQTTLLDSHPTLDLVVPAKNGTTVVEVDADQQSVTDRRAIRVVKRQASSVAVLLGPHDAPFTTAIDDPGSLRLRLFGEFLEKGVIRRARPWLILDRSGAEITPEFARAALGALTESPLPLT